MALIKYVHSDGAVLRADESLNAFMSARGYKAETKPQKSPRKPRKTTSSSRSTKAE